MIVEWMGSDVEKLALYRSVRRNCECIRPLGVLKQQCGAHVLLIPDQKIWNGLLCSRRRAEKLLLEEFTVTKWLPGSMYRGILS